MLMSVRRALVVGSVLVTAACSVGVGGLRASSTDDAGGSSVGPADVESPDATSTSSGGGHLSPGDGGTPSTAADDASDSDTDAQAEDAGITMTRPPFDASACDDASGPCVVVPGGWTLVAFAPNQASACPAGFDSAPSTDVVEGPDASAACSCGSCSVTSMPSCSAGPVDGFYDYRATVAGGTCDMPDTTPTLANNGPGACNTDIYSSGTYSSFDVEYVGPPPSGGACTAPGTPEGAAVTYAFMDRTCAPDSPQAANCVGDVCRPTLPPSYGACIATAGVQACPQGPLGVQHIVGASASFTCGGCGCTLSSTCAGTITLYTDTRCSTGAKSIPSGDCVAITADVTYESYKFAGGAPTNVTCKSATTGPGQGVTLTGEETLCCTQ
jgi:hypothetical protein